MSFSHPKCDLQRAACFIVLGFAVLALGCKDPTLGGSGTYTPPANYKYISGNWQFQTTPVTGAPPFTSLAGFIAEGGGQAGLNDYTTAVLMVKSATCYSTSVEIPLTGGTNASQVNLVSFPVDGQTLTLIGTKDDTATHLTGTYVIAGGCADGARGTLTGTLYTPISGVYVGSFGASAPGRGMQLTLTQGGDGSGDGLSYLKGSAFLSGFPCFQTGNLPYATPGAYFPGYVLGAAISLDFTTDEAAGSHIVMTGTFDADGKTIHVQSFAIIGGSCASVAAPTSLTLVKQ